MPTYCALPRDPSHATDLGRSSWRQAGCPPGHSPSHLALDPVWAQAQEAGIPIVLHVGGGGKLLDPHYFTNGLPPVPDFHGGAENFRSVDYMAIPFPVMQTLSALIFDGVLDRFPRLKIGVIEQGACWVPGFMRQLDSALRAFSKMEERLQKLALKPSEYVVRQIRVTPYPTEDVGWIIREAGEEVCLFSSDYPHVEGGRNFAKAATPPFLGTARWRCALAPELLARADMPVSELLLLGVQGAFLN